MTNKKPQLLIVANTPSANTETLAGATEDGGKKITGVVVRRLSPAAATAADIFSCSAIIIGTTENFGYMSGQIKDFFERVYYPCLPKTEALPWALYVRAGKDGAGTIRGVQSIVGGLRWRQMRPPLLLQGDYKEEFKEECKTLGEFAAAGLEAGIF